MKAKTLNIYGENRFEEHTRLREASRGIVLSGGKLLLTYEVNTDQWFIPGGGLEPGESPEQCCVRELAEETGCAVTTRDHFLTIHEYYEEWKFVSHYFTCELTGEVARSLTERELEVGLEPRWVDFDEAVEIFSKHQDYAAENEMKRGAYLREYEALRCYKGRIVKEEISERSTLSLPAWERLKLLRDGQNVMCRRCKESVMRPVGNYRTTNTFYCEKCGNQIIIN